MQDMTVGYSPICLPAVRPLPSIFIVYSKFYKIIVLCFDFLPLFPIYLPYSSPYPFVKPLDVTFHICNRIISKPTYCISFQSFQSFEYYFNRPCLFSTCQLSDFVLKLLNAFAVRSYSCLLSCLLH